MEQVKVLNIVKERVNFVRKSAQEVVAMQPMTIEFFDKGFVVKYILQQNKIIHIVFDCRQIPTKEHIENMKPYLSIDNIDNVHVVTPDSDNKCVQVWLWKDLVDRIVTKEVLENGKSDKNNVQNKPRRNKVVKSMSNSCKDFTNM